MRGHRIGILAAVLVLTGLMAPACENKVQQPAPQPAPTAPQPAAVPAAAPAPAPLPPPAIDYDKLAEAIAARIDTGRIADQVVERIKKDRVTVAPSRGEEAARERPAPPERKRPEAGAEGRGRDAAEKRPPRPVPKTVWKATLRGDEPMKGATEALVTIVEFSDFECPFCGRVEPALDQILQAYGDKVRVVWKNNPLSFHKNARAAALAACAAQQQGKFWELHKLLFENQRALAPENLTEYAKGLGLDMGRFETDMNGTACASAVDADMKLANDVGARGTPNLYVNGRQVRGAVPFEHIEPVLKEEIQKAEGLLAKGIVRTQIYDEIMKEGKVFKPLADEVATWTAKAPFKGAENGQIVVTMYSDFQCPYCSRVKQPIYDLMKEYPDNIRVEFRHFPLSFHKDAHLAAQASMAADAQGRFWEMHDKIFDNQKALKREDLDRYAQEVSLDLEAFRKALDEGTYKEIVDLHMSEGQKAGVRGTPSIFINGRKFDAPARDVPTFKAIIDSEVLKK